MLLEVSQLYALSDISSALTAVSSLLAIALSSIKVFQVVQSRNLQKQLSKYFKGKFDAGELRVITRYFISPKWQLVSSANFLEPKPDHVQGDLIKHMMHVVSNPSEEFDKKYFFILGGAGMGKTAILVNFVKAFKKSYKHKSKRVYYFQFSEVDLLEKIKTQIQDKTIRPEKSILLLDGFDEDVKAIRDKNNRLKEIELFLAHYKFFKVVITARTKFFKSKDLEPSETEEYSEVFNRLYAYGKIYIAPFTKKEMFTYLNGRFSFFERRKRRLARGLIESSQQLMSRPFVISHVFGLLAQEKKARKRVVFRYYSDVYDAIIAEWIEREAGILFSKKSKYKGILSVFNPKELAEAKRSKETFKKELREFSKILASSILSLDLEMFAMPLKDAYLIAHIHNFKSLNELNLENRSLLNRLDDGRYKFSHKSLLDYFLALYFFETAEFQVSNAFISEVESDGFLDFEKFYFDLVIRETIRNCKCKGYFYINGERNSLQLLNSSHFKEVSALELQEYDSIDFRFLRLLPKLEKVSLHNQIDIEGTELKYFIYLKALVIRNRQITDVSFISKIKDLTYLDISNYADNEIRKMYLERYPGFEISYEVYHNGVKQLQNKVSNLDELQQLEQLETLLLGQTSVRNINFVHDFQSLERLSISHTQVSNLSPVHRLSNLRTLNAVQNEGIDLAPLEGLNLERVSIGSKNLEEKSINILKGMEPTEVLVVYESPENFNCEEICRLNEIGSLKKLELLIEDKDIITHYRNDITSSFPDVQVIIDEIDIEFFE